MPPAEIGRFEITLPPANFVDFGLRLTIEPISGIQKALRPIAAGFRKGDRIVKVDGKDDFDPMRLPSRLLRACRQADDVRGRAPGGGRLQSPADDRPRPRTRRPPGPSSSCSNEALEVPGLGLCYPVTTHVEAVAPTRPPRRRGSRPGT